MGIIDNVNIMKKVIRIFIVLSVVSLCSYGVISCEPEKPVTPIIPPTPGPNPDPGPDPNPDPNPNPDPEPEPEESVIYYDNLDGSTTSGVWFDQALSCLTRKAQAATTCRMPAVVRRLSPPILQVVILERPVRMACTIWVRLLIYRCVT